MDPDEYLCELIVELPDEVVDTITRMAAQKQRPPLTPYDLADALANAGTPNFAIRLRDHLDMVRADGASTSTMSRTGDRARPPFVQASDVGPFLTAHRPPEYRDITLIVPTHEPVGIASHLIVLNTALLEMLKVWPNGTTLVVEYDDETYAQVLTYPPDILTEIGPLTQLQMAKAIKFGWMNPAGLNARHDDFKSQPVWADNPVREWTHPSDRSPEIAAFLAASVRAILGRDPGDGYTLRLFNNLLEGKVDEI